MRRGALVLLLLLAAQPAPAADPSASGADYGRLVAAARLQPTEYDFAALRAAYADSPGATDDPAAVLSALGRLGTALAKAPGDLERILALKALLDRHLGDGDLQRLGGVHFARAGFTDEALWRGWLAEGLTAAVLASGDGWTPATAWRIETIGEQMLVLDHLELDDLPAFTQEARDKRILEHATVRLPGGLERPLWFDVTRPVLRASRAAPPRPRTPG